VNDAKFIKAYNDRIKYPDINSIAIALGISNSTVTRTAQRLRANGVKLIDRSKKEDSEIPRIIIEHNKEMQSLKAKNTSLRAQLTEMQQESVTLEKLKDLIHGMDGYVFGGDSSWLTYEKKTRRTTGTPTLLISDVHFDERVAPEQIEWANEYNHEIATERLKHVFNSTYDLLLKRMAAPKYDGIIVAFAGDLLSGNIHDELVESNDDVILRSILSLSDLLIEGIGNMADEFGKVFVPCVVGNHGRMHKKPRTKSMVCNNFEWLIYQNLARYFKTDSRLTFLIPEGPDANFQVYDKHFLLTHGDQFRGGSGIAGIFSPVMLGASRKKTRQQAIKTPFDILLMGHFHQYIHTELMVINGALKGYDQYAYYNNFPFEHPKQALWINHPEQGMTFRMPITCNSYQKKNAVRVK
jgi:predicted phosphodiesterase/DNA-binding MarR family transcriptional regulator